MLVVPASSPASGLLTGAVAAGLTAHDEAAQAAAFEADAFGAVCRGMASEMVGEPRGAKPQGAGLDLRGAAGPPGSYELWTQGAMNHTGL